MKIDIAYLKKIIDFDETSINLKELLASLGIEVAEIITTDQGQQVFEVEVTPNRPDWLSHYGVAREIHAKHPEFSIKPLEPGDLEVSQESSSRDLSIEIVDSEACPRYTGCALRDIEVTESPREIRELLTALGLRPINNIVDVSNIVMLTMGQPLHIFDLDCIENQKVRIRFAEKGEKIVLLDESEIELDQEDIVIADAKKPVALAGIMGGSSSGITENTRNIFIESAHFNPVKIRKSARRLGISTDASYRFERGCDIMATEEALKYAVELIGKWGNNSKKVIYYEDVFSGTFIPQKITMEKDFPSTYTGIDIDAGRSHEILTALGFKVSEKSAQSWLVEVPSFRVDLHGKRDLVEEIIRIIGYDILDYKIPATVNSWIQVNEKREFKEKIHSHMVANGYFECLNFIFHSPENNDGFHSDRKDSIEIKNPLGRDYSILRNSLIPGLLKNCALNLNNGFERITLFESGRIFWKNENEHTENERLGMVAAGNFSKSDWKNKKNVPFNIYNFRGQAENLLKSLHADYSIAAGQFNWFVDGMSLSIHAGGCEIGWMGQLSESEVKKYGIQIPVYAMEIDLDKLGELLKEKKFQNWAKFPAVKRDFSFFIESNLNYEQIAAEIETHRPKILESFELFDYYAAEKEKGGKISLAMTFTYRHTDRTLTGEEVSDAHQKLVDTISENLKIEKR